MKVIAVGPTGGYFDNLRRRTNDVFVIPDKPRRTPSKKEAALPPCKEAMDAKGTVPELFSSLWMRKASQNAKENVSTVKDGTEIRSNIIMDDGKEIGGGGNGLDGDDSSVI